MSLINIQAVRHIRIGYILAISIIATLVVASHIIMKISTNKAEFDSRIINLSGRQRMLSQKITKSVFGVYISAASENKRKYRRYRSELKYALELWTKSHYGLIHGDEEAGLPGQNTEQISILFDSIEKSHQTIVRDAKKVITLIQQSSFTASEVLPLLNEIRKHEQVFLPIMNRIVDLYDDEANEKVKATQNINIALLFATLIALMLEAMFIFRPMEKSVGQTISVLLDNEENLQKLFDVSPDILILIDPENFSITRLNQRAGQLLNINQEDAHHYKMTDFVDEKMLRKTLQVEYDKHGNIVSDVDAFVVSNRGDKNLNMLMSISRLFYHNEMKLLVGLTDITKQKKNQAKLSHYATVDELTGLVNRRAGLMFAKKTLYNSRRNMLDLSFCFVDIDGLKQVNDVYGHNEGDWLIKNAAKAILSNIRSGDVCFRYGGDEMVIVFQSCNIEHAVITMRRVLRDVKLINKQSNKPYQLSISYGFSSLYEGDERTSDQIIKTADEEMYKSKNQKKKKEREEMTLPLDMLE